jgi:hypothetical protein
VGSDDAGKPGGPKTGKPDRDTINLNRRTSYWCRQSIIAEIREDVIRMNEKIVL